jgi:hypothetical protein
VDTLRYNKAIALHLWLFGYEVPGALKRGRKHQCETDTSATQTRCCCSRTPRYTFYAPQRKACALQTAARTCFADMMLSPLTAAVLEPLVAPFKAEAGITLQVSFH